MKEFTSEIKLIFSGNNHPADNKKEYIEKVKSQFFDGFGLILDDKEITNIQILENN